MNLARLGANVFRIAAKTPEVSVVPSKVTVLVVEDDVELRKLVMTSLALEGFQVAAATNGAECVSHVRRSRPDIVLLDLVLPWVNGIEVLGTLRADPQTRDVPVVVMTGTPTRPQDLHGLGPVDILYKPFEQERLLSLIVTVLRRPPGRRSRKVQLAE